MSIVLIVNIIVSLSIALGGFCMKGCADDPADYSIGFRTKRAMSSKAAWSYANKTCGRLWIITGAAVFVLTIAAVFLSPDDSTSAVIQTVILVINVTAVAVSCIFVELQLKNRYDRQ